MITFLLSLANKEFDVIDRDEKELLVLIKNDDRSAIKILFEKYHSTLCRVAYRLLKDKDHAKDIVQEVFIKFWNNRTSIEINTSLAGYLKRSVINASLNHLEKEKRHPSASFDQLPNHPMGTAADQDYALAELTRRVESAINNLPVRTRAVFILIRQEEMSYKEASESLNISMKAIEKEMMKALRLLREMLKQFLTLAIGLSTWL